MENFDEKMKEIYITAEEAKDAIHQSGKPNNVLMQLRWLSRSMQTMIENGMEIKDIGKCNKALDAIKQVDDIISQYVENSKKYMWLIDMAVKGFEEAVKDC